MQPRVRGRGGKRITASERRKAHDERQKKKLAPPAPEAVPEPKIEELDHELAAEIQAMKADDARKGKFYTRKRSQNV